MLLQFYFELFFKGILSLTHTASYQAFLPLANTNSMIMSDLVPLHIRNVLNGHDCVK